VGQTITETDGSNDSRNGGSTISEIPCQTITETLGQRYPKYSTDKKRNKQHEVFEPSFDWKECNSDKFIGQKLDYIHDNPCRGACNLAKEPIEYLHSSTRYYATGFHAVHEVTSFSELENIDLTKKSIMGN
jgi:hypothetical protein